jgi:hypothetical protein
VEEAPRLSIVRGAVVAHALSIRHDRDVTARSRRFMDTVDATTKRISPRRSVPRVMLDERS